MKTCLFFIELIDLSIKKNHCFKSVKLKSNTGCKDTGHFDIENKLYKIEKFKLIPLSILTKKQAVSTEVAQPVLVNYRKKLSF